MDVYIQQCQHCRSRNLRNILVRDDAQRVYVQCRQCDQLVARYIIAPGGYFHEGKDYESFLRTRMLDGGFLSGRDLKAAFQDVSDSCAKGFGEAVRRGQKKYGDPLP